MIRALLVFFGAVLLIDGAYLLTVKVSNLGALIPLFTGPVLLALGAKWVVWQRLVARRMALRRCWYLLCWGALAWLLSLSVFVAVLSNQADSRDGNIKPQALVVLGSSTPRQTPSPTLALRLDKALALAQKYPDTVVVTSGGVDSTETVSEAQVMGDYLRAKGLAPQRILQEEKSTSTHENFLFSKAMLEREGFGNNPILLVVTSDFHTLRSAKIALHAGLKNVQTVGAQTPLYVRYNAWLREYFAFISGWLFNEY